MNLGVPPTARNARTGEFTPPGITRCARSNNAAEAGASTCPVWQGGRHARRAHLVRPLSMMHLRVVCSQDLEDQVVDTLRSRAGVVAVLRSDLTSDGRIVSADVAREIADKVLRELHQLGVQKEGMIALTPIDAAFGALAERAENDAPGEADDAVIWDELTKRIDEDATLTWTFLGF